MSLRTVRGRSIRALALPLVLSIGGLAATSPAAATNAPIVQTADGAVSGTTSSGFRAFFGIPFAAPPVGNWRWKPPQPVVSWRGVRDATEPGSPCPSLPLPSLFAIPSRAGSINEDCLYLNIYTPQPSRHRMPVMVGIHGGAFAGGAGTDYDASVLTTKAKVVVVTINYRLGPFGFLALPGLSAEAPDHASGNFGIEDQQAALGWVKRNIAYFGGDAGNVTIFGQSAGGASVCVHLASPTSRGLFDRAIVQSSPCTNLWPTLSNAESAGVTIAHRLSCDDPTTQVACMRAKPVREILAAFGRTPSGPNVDGAVLPQQVPTAISSGAFNRVPVMEGTTHDEYRFNVAVRFDLVGNPVTADTYPALIETQFGANTPSVLAEYPPSSFDSPGLALATAVTDARYACAARDANRLLAAQVQTFAYEFNDQDPPPYLITVRLAGAVHGSEVPYILQPIDAASLFTPEQLALSDQMIRYWSRFAAAGNPNSFATPFWPLYITPTDRDDEHRDRHAQEDEELDIFQSLAPENTRPTSTFAEDHRCAFWASLTRP